MFYLTVKTKSKQHEEEQYRPQLGRWKVRQSLWVRHKRQSVPALRDVLDVNADFLRHTAERCKDDKASDNTSDDVHDTDQQRVPGKETNGKI